MALDICISWSGGKDSSIAYERILYNGNYRIAGIFTAYNNETGRVNLHNVPIQLIRLQAKSMGIDLYEIPLSPNAKNEEYEKEHNKLFGTLKGLGINHLAFGDIYLEHIKEYRDKLIQNAAMEVVYPLWGNDCTALAEEFISRGFQAVIASINNDVLDQSFLGRKYDEQFIADLPGNVDVCGENGEFHTFVYDGPFFSEPVGFHLGAVTEMDYRPVIDMKMKFIDLLYKS